MATNKPTTIPSWTHARTELARAVRNHRPQSEVDALRAKYVLARTATQVRSLLAAAPPLPDEQIAELHAVLDEAHALASTR